MGLKDNPVSKQFEKGKRNLFTAAFILGAFPFLLVMLLQVATYAGVILLVCVGLGVILRLAVLLHRRY